MWPIGSIEHWGFAKKKFPHLDSESKSLAKVYQLLVLFFLVPATGVAWMFIHC